MSKRRKLSSLPVRETSARLRRFAQTTRDESCPAGMAPFPEHETVLAEPLRRIRRQSPDDNSLQ